MILLLSDHESGRCSAQPVPDATDVEEPREPGPRGPQRAQLPGGGHLQVLTRGVHVRIQAGENTRLDSLELFLANPRRFNSRNKKSSLNPSEKVNCPVKLIFRPQTRTNQKIDNTFLMWYYLIETVVFVIRTYLSFRQLFFDHFYMKNK